MTDNQLNNAHTYQAIKFSAREKTHCYKKRLGSYGKKALYYNIDLNLRNKYQERYAGHTSSEG